MVTEVCLPMSVHRGKGGKVLATQQEQLGTTCPPQDKGSLEPTLQGTRTKDTNVSSQNIF